MKDDFWDEEPSGQPSVPTKRKRRAGKRKLEFIEWASRPLIGFLEAIGEDTRKKHSRHEVAAFISKYINEKGLASSQKKKKVLCDEILFALFGKKSVSRIKVYDLLEEHFAENHDDSDGDSLDSSDEANYRIKLFLEKMKVPETPKTYFAAVIPENIKLVYLKRILILELLRVPESFENKIVGSFVRVKLDPNVSNWKSRFQLQLVTGVEKISGAGDEASEVQLKVANSSEDIPVSLLSEDNFSKEEVEDVQGRIKAGLLKRLTVNELELKAQMLHADITKHEIAKELSMLRCKIDHANEKGWRREFFQYLNRRNMLQNPSEVEKLLTKMPKVIAEKPEPEATIADPYKNAEGSSCSPTLAVKGISKVSGKDVSGPGAIVTPREVLLNDLNAPKVQDGGTDETILVKTPNGSGAIVTPCELLANDLDALKVQDGGTDETILVKTPNGSGAIVTPCEALANDLDAPKVQDGGTDETILVKTPNGSGAIVTPCEVLLNDLNAPKVQDGGTDETILVKTPNGPGAIITPREVLLNDLNAPKVQDGGTDETILVKTPNGYGDTCQTSQQMDGMADGPADIQHGTKPAEVMYDQNDEMTQVINTGGNDIPEKPKLAVGTTQVIELSDYESEDEDPRGGGSLNPSDTIWHYMDPHGQTQGPFCLYALKKWSDKNFFDAGFIVWRSGQTSKDGVLLVDVLRQTFRS